MRTTRIPKIRAFLLGAREYRTDWTRALRHLLPCYDAGREWAHRITFRRFDF
jgi:hypothetical protein